MGSEDRKGYGRVVTHNKFLTAAIITPIIYAPALAPV